MYKVIVVGTDGSARASVAVREAVALAKAAEATLHVVYVVRPTSASTLGTEYADHNAIAAAKEEMHKQGNEICALVVADAKREGVTTQVHNVEGDPGDVLVKVAGGVDADLLVIGNRGMTGVKRFVLGSVPNKVSHHCPCSLLIVDTDSD
jgi:nucleotide-binding universal stress UspA family protein